jgi:hypothetical protein
MGQTVKNLNIDEEIENSYILCDQDEKDPSFLEIIYRLDKKLVCGELITTFEYLI